MLLFVQVTEHTTAWKTHALVAMLPSGVSRMATSYENGQL